MQIRPRRSVLYMPGPNARALEKARTIPADALILDLEDAVAPDAKETARAAGLRGRQGRRLRPARARHPHQRARHPLGRGRPARGRERGARCRPAAEGGAAGRHRAGPRRWAPRRAGQDAAVGDDGDAARSSTCARSRPRADPAAARLLRHGHQRPRQGDARPRHSPTARLAPWLPATVAARAYGLDVLDGVYNNFRDEAGFRRECVHGRTLGFDGKTLIHPDQVAVQRGVLAPEAEVAWSRARSSPPSRSRRTRARASSRSRAAWWSCCTWCRQAHGRHRRGDRGHAQGGGAVLLSRSVSHARQQKHRLGQQVSD